MNHYIAQFLIYTLAMTGFIVLALYIYKKSTCGGILNSEKNFLKVENVLRLTPSKMLYVIQAGSERFLIAGDSQNTVLISKLEYEPVISEKV